LTEAPVLQVGRRFEVTLTGTRDGKEYTALARVTRRVDAANAVEYGFQHADPGRVASKLPRRLRSAFNRQPTDRPPWPRADRVTVTVLATEGAERGRRALGKVLALREEGVTLLLGMHGEEVLVNSPTVICTYRPSDQQEQLRRACQIVSRQLEGKRIVYGLRFIEVGTVQSAEKAREFEPLWDCSHCSTRHLLAHSHVYCPECGNSRGEVSTYFPRWEEAKPVQENWATGDARVCVFCSAGFSDLAEFCGRCGKPLP